MPLVNTYEDRGWPKGSPPEKSVQLWRHPKRWYAPMGVGEVEIEIDVQGSLRRAWGAGASDVWVTGDQGVMVHFAP